MRTGKSPRPFDVLGRRKYEQRDNAAADGYKYDPADEVTFYRREGSLNADGSVSGGSTVVDFDPYDGNGNKTDVRTNGKLDTYVANNLNQYASTTALGALGYDLDGNLETLQGWRYTYDAQNRLIALDHGALNVHIRQHYDPLNRMIARDNNGVITTYVWDNWNLLEERKGNGAIKRCYLYGAGQNELVQAFEGGVYAKLWYWQDGRGNTAAVSGDAGFLVERYRYDLTGTPSFYDANNVSQASANDTRFLFAGSLYQPETGLYDMRNRFYHVTLSRFLQTDPLGLQLEGMKPSAAAAAFFPEGQAPEKFGSTELNLYRYCHNDPVNKTDPFGLEDIFISRQLDQLGSQASLNSLAASIAAKDGNDRSQLVQERNGQLSLQQKFNVGVTKEEKVGLMGRLQTQTRQVEEARPDKGQTEKAIGHVHMDKTARPKHDSKFSKDDEAQARKGTPVYKVNESDPSRVDRLTPQKDRDDKPTIVRVR